MPKEFEPHSLDVAAFAEQADELRGSAAVGDYERLMVETEGRGAQAAVSWSVTGEMRHPLHLQPEVWLHLHVRTTLALTCQRCLDPVDVPVKVNRDFRFVADEATAAAQDDEAEEDVLVASRQFNLLELVEDEVLMALPAAPMHEACCAPLPNGPSDELGEPLSPFAVLDRLRRQTK